MATTYYVGTAPSQGLLLEVNQADGTDRDLTGYTVASQLVSDSALPSHAVQVADAAAGLVQVNWLAPFTSPGAYEFQVALSNANGNDYTTPFTVRVLSSFTAAVVTSEEAYRVTGEAVSASALARAQSLISSYLDRDLADTLWFGYQSDRDQARMKRAVAYQAVSDAAVSSTIEAPRGVKAVSVGDLSLTYADGYLPDGISIAPLAGLELKRLSWRGGSFTVKGRKHSKVWESALVDDNHAWYPIGR